MGLAQTLKNLEVRRTAQVHRTGQTRKRDRLGHMIRTTVDEVLLGTTDDALAHARQFVVARAERDELLANAFRMGVGHDVDHELRVRAKLAEHLAGSVLERHPREGVVVRVEEVHQTLPVRTVGVRSEVIEHSPSNGPHAQVGIDRRRSHDEAGN